MKLVMAEETAALTRNAAIFITEPKIRTTELRPDGLLCTSLPDALRDLAAPWCHLRCEAVFDGKMPGGKLDPEEFQRVLLPA